MSPRPMAKLESILTEKDGLLNVRNRLMTPLSEEIELLPLA